MPIPTRQQLADILQKVNVAAVAERAEVSTKTIYRLRKQQTAPTLDTVEAILAAVKAVKASEAKARKALEASKGPQTAQAEA